jgi:hypothetical protein
VGTHRKRSRRGAFFALVLLVLSAGCGYEWWRSQSNFTTLRVGGFAVMTAEGKVCLLHTDAAPAGQNRDGFHSVPYDRASKTAAIIQWPTFGYSWPTDPAQRESKLTVVAPLWCVAGVLALPSAWWVLRGRKDAALADEMD